MPDAGMSAIIAGTKNLKESATEVKTSIIER